MQRVSAILGFFLFLISITTLHAQAPQLINYQGKLNQGGNAANGNFDITFAVYNVATGGTALYSETHTNLAVSDGLFNVLLGSVTALPADLFTSGGDRFLGVKVGNDSEMAPRFRFASVAYSMNAGAVAGGSNIFPGDDNVGIGTINPSAKLEIIGGPIEQVRLAGAGNPNHWNIFHNTLDSNDFGLTFSHSNGKQYLILNASGENTSFPEGNVGIGTTDPGEKLDVVGNIQASNRVTANEVRVLNSTGNEIVFLTADAFGQNGGKVEIFDNANRQVARMESNDRGGAAIAVSNSLGNTAAFMTNSLTDAGIVVVQDIDGVFNLVTLTTTGTGNDQSGFISVRDAGGTQTAGINGQTGDVFGNSKSFIVPDPTNSERMIRYTSIEGPEAAIYLRGKARLAGGRANVEFPDHFKAMAVPSSITVSLTPRSLDSKGLAAVEVSASGMQVGELAQGSGNYLFDYVVYGVRKGYEDYQVYVDKN